MCNFVRGAAAKKTQQQICLWQGAATNKQKNMRRRARGLTVPQIFLGVLAQFGRACRSQRQGIGIEARVLQAKTFHVKTNKKKIKAFVAQVAEHSPSKRKAKGSNPFGGFFT